MGSVVVCELVGRMNRRGFFSATVGLLAGALLPKSLQTVDAADVVWEPASGRIDHVMFYWDRCLTEEEVRSWTEAWNKGTYHITPVLKEGYSKSTPHRSNSPTLVRWPANKPFTVTVGKANEDPGKN